MGLAITAAALAAVLVSLPVARPVVLASPTGWLWVAVAIVLLLMAGAAQRAAWAAPTWCRAVCRAMPVAHGLAWGWAGAGWIARGDAATADVVALALLALAWQTVHRLASDRIVAGLALGATLAPAIAVPTWPPGRSTVAWLLVASTVAGLAWLAWRGRRRPPARDAASPTPVAAHHAVATADDRLHLLEPLLQATRQGFWYIDTQGLTVDVNPAMCRLLGRPREQIVGHSVFEFFTDADLATLRAQIEARRRGQVGGYEVGLERPDGTRIHCHNNATPVHDRHGAVIGSIGLWTDITAHRQAETALRTYELVANSMTDMVSVVDEDLVYRMVNDAWCRNTGNRREDVVGKRAFDVLAAVQNPARRAALRECIEQRQVRTVRAAIELPRLAGRIMETTYMPYVGADAEARCVVMVTRDVTEQEQRTQLLAASESELRTLLDAFPGFITRIDENLVFTYANPQVAARLGVTQDAMIGQRIRDVVGTEREAWLVQYFERAWRGERVTYERQHLLPSGETLTDQVTLVVGADPRSGKRSIYTFGVDITERKRAEERLRDTSRQLEHKSAQLTVTLDNIAQGIVSIGADGRTHFYNQQALELLGLPEHLMQAPSTFDDVVKFQIARGELDANARYLDAQGQWQTIKGGRRHAPEVYVRRNHAGKLLEVRTRHQSDGTLLRTFADVTPYYEAQQALRQSENELRAVLDAFPGYIAAVDQHGVYRYVNDRFTGLVGLTRQDMVGRSMRDVLGEARFVEIKREVDRARAGERVRSERHYVTPDDRRTVHLEITHVAGPVQPDGHQNVYAFSTDITARKQAEAELVAARDEAQRASNAKSQFVSHMSHELRTPLNAILGFGQLLESDTVDPLSPTQRRQVVEILRGGRHLLGLINDLLDLGSIEAGQMLLSTEAVPVDRLLNECLNLMRPLAEAHAVGLERHGVDAESLRVAADSTRLKQVLLNLLGNAIKYNRRPGMVDVRVHRDGEQVRIAVTDSGLGLSLEQQERLFRPFERLDAMRRGIEGTGIGLALSRRLVEAMRGTIGVDSTVGVGSTFWIRMPLLHGATQPAATRPQRLAHAEPAAASVQAPWRSVLYIEDNPVNMLVMQATLARVPGLRFIGASTPAAGLELARREQPELILLDIGLPDQDGHEVLARLRSDPRTSPIPVVAVTANAMPAEIEAAMAAGFADYLTKPFEIEHLIAVVTRLTSDA